MPMSSRKPGLRSVEMTFDVPGTPEQVWDAIATGPGIGAWFVPSEVEARVGGVVRFHLGGGMESAGQVTVWDPPRVFAYEEFGWSEGAPPLGTEFIVEALAGGTCRIRLVHSLASDDPRWDAEIGGMEEGWPPFFDVLRIYLADFAGQPAGSIRPMAPHAGSLDQAWADMQAALGLAGAAPGERRLAPAGAPAFGGVVQRTRAGGHTRETLVRLETPMPGAALAGVFRMGEQTHVAISLFLYGEDGAATAAREAPKWEVWLATVKG